MSTSDGIRFLDSNDYFLAPIYLFLILIVALLFRNISLYKTQIGKYFMPGLMVKIIGALGLGLVYGFYYHGGDTFYYYSDSITFNLSIYNNFDIFLKLLLLPAHTYTPLTYDYTKFLTYFHQPSGWMAVKVYGLISIFTFHSYFTMALVTSALTFTGVWVLYLTFVDLYPQLYKPFAYCVLFVPSVFFWGSGVLKDSITLGCIGWITYCSYLIFFKGRKVFGNSIMLFIMGYIALQIKAYIVISFLPALLFWVFLTYRSKISNQFLRVVSGPAVFAISLLSGFIMTQQLGREFSQFSLQNVYTTAQTYQQWHSFLAEHENASGYSLGNMSGSLTSIIRSFPLAVNVTLFRPYLWEAHSAIMMISALENAFILGFTIYIIWKNGLRRVIRAIRKNPTVFFCFFFSILFAFCVGFTAYNFGALVRYKIPCIPFYLVGLVILNHLTAIDRKQHEAEQGKRRPVFHMKSKSIPEPESAV